VDGRHGQTKQSHDDGITYNDEPSLLNSNLDKSLGAFFNEARTACCDCHSGCPPVLSAIFRQEIWSGLFLTATTNSTVWVHVSLPQFRRPHAIPLFGDTAVPISQSPRLVIIGSDVKISFTTTNGVSYSVDYNNDLVTRQLNTLTNNITGTGRYREIMDSGAAGIAPTFLSIGGELNRFFAMLYSSPMSGVGFASTAMNRRRVLATLGPICRSSLR